MLAASEVKIPALRRPQPVFLTVLALAAGIVTFLWLLTNHMTPQWDMQYYVDMAARGVRGNQNLAAPFAYRPGAPLLVGAVAGFLHTDPELTFRISNGMMCVVFLLSCFYFARSLGGSFYAAAFASVSLAFNFYVVKWTIFSGTMVDIYAYPFLLAAFWALLRKRSYLCLAICAIGLLFKEFLLVPLAVQTVILLIESRFRVRQISWQPFLLTALVLGVCFVIPRLAIHVAHTFQDVDPLNDESTLRRLLTYPLSRRHDFNILFAYLAGWFPILALLTRGRLALVWDRLYPHRLLLLLFLAFHFLLVMYGGTNIDIYITYCAPIQIMILVVVLEESNVRVWEACLALVMVFGFNRLWKTVPLPENGMDAYLDFYGGYYMRVNQNSFFRMGELVAYLLGINLVRFLVRRFAGTVAGTGSAIRQVPSNVL